MNAARRRALAVSFAIAAALFANGFAHADPSKYPEFAQQKLPDDIKPEFISVDQLSADIKAGKTPVIIDVRSEEEFHEVHILSARSAPLGEFTFHLATIPRDRPLVLY